MTRNEKILHESMKLLQQARSGRADKEALKTLAEEAKQEAAEAAPADALPMWLQMAVGFSLGPDLKLRILSSADNANAEFWVFRSGWRDAYKACDLPRTNWEGTDLYTEVCRKLSEIAHAIEMHLLYPDEELNWEDGVFDIVDTLSETAESYAARSQGC